MTVAELIALLSRYPPEAEVIFHDEEIAIEHDSKTLDQINENGTLTLRLLECDCDQDGHPDIEMHASDCHARTLDN